MEVLLVELSALSVWLHGGVGCTIALYSHITWTHSTFRKMGLPGPAPGILGNMADFAKDGVAKSDVRYINKYGRVVGLFHARYPVMLISDPETVRDICVKQFANFNKRAALDVGVMSVAPRKFFFGYMNRVVEARRKSESELPTYDNVRKLPYLDRVLSETLRMYPAVTRTGRRSRDAITVKGYHITAGMCVSFPIFAMHHDPEFWSEPETFHPDRFLPENRGHLHSYYYLPFGVGPKSCTGMRLATLATKMTLVTILQHFLLETTPDTEIYDQTIQ